jgi:hypothetical protein
MHDVFGEVEKRDVPQLTAREEVRAVNTVKNR